MTNLIFYGTMQMLLLSEAAPLKNQAGSSVSSSFSLAATANNHFVFRWDGHSPHLLEFDLTGGLTTARATIAHYTKGLFA